jgi:phosphoserine phosphatase RsbU/P
VSQHRRIAVIAGWMGDIYSQAVVAGIRATALARRASVICFSGSELPPLKASEARSRIYDLVTPDTIDGVILLSTTTLQSPEKLDEVAKRFAPLPVVSVGIPSSTIPSVVIDNETGLRAEIDHLVEQHGARLIAFIGGPEQNAEARIRYRVYCDTLSRHGLAVDPKLTAQVPMRETDGEAAMDAILKRTPKLDAVVGSCDALALGALRALARKGMRVPSEVAVVGFDDEPAAASAVPSLTTVRQPVLDLGRSAADTVLDWLATGAPAPDAMVPTELVVRHSCGCMPHLRPTSRPPKRAGGRSWPPVHTPEELERVLAELEVPSKRRLHALIQALGQDLDEEKAEHSLQVMAETVVEHGHDPDALRGWRKVLDLTHQLLLPNVEGTAREVVSALLYEGQSLLGDAIVRACKSADRAELDRVKSLVTMLSFMPDCDDLDEVVAHVHAGLRELEVPGCQVVLLDTDKDLSRLVLCHSEGETVALAKGGVTFPRRELFAKGFEPPGPSFTLVSPLATGSDYHGYALFDGKPEEWVFHASLTHLMSASLSRFTRETEIGRLKASLPPPA